MQPRIKGRFASLNPEKRFWAKVSKTKDCWLWKGSIGSGGYGLFWASGRCVRAHRYSYELEQQIPKGLELDHLCRVKSCVNPAHLEAVTHQENVIRGFIKLTEGSKDKEDK